MSEWISVNDRLPENRVPVLTCGRYGIKVLYHTYYFLMGLWGWADDPWIFENEVTHWMPIPELPKEE